MSGQNNTAPTQPSQFQIDEAYKQVKLNTRQKALDYVMDTLRIGIGANMLLKFTTDEIISDAKRIEQYLLEGIQAPTAYVKPTIVPAKNIP